MNVYGWGIVPMVKSDNSFLYSSGNDTFSFEEEVQGVHFGLFGGHEFRTGDFGQPARRAASVAPGLTTAVVFSGSGFRTAMPEAKVFWNVVWRCEFISSARANRSRDCESFSRTTAYLLSSVGAL
jgi:hypothetical protein